MGMITGGDEGVSLGQTRQTEMKLARRVSIETVDLEPVQKPTIRRLEIANGTATGTEIDKSVRSKESLSSTDRLYPHVFDPASAAGEALVHVQSAINDIQLAIDDYGDADLISVSSRLSQVGASMKKAHTHADFNECFGAVTSFVRRATLAAVPEDITRPALNSVLSGLRQLRLNPLLGLDEATDLIDRLSTDGWNGSHTTVEKIISALLAESDLDYEHIQAMLFPTAA
jgi:hypothetical protein